MAPVAVAVGGTEIAVNICSVVVVAVAVIVFAVCAPSVTVE
jgi:hypothetical protein